MVSMPDANICIVTQDEDNLSCLMLQEELEKLNNKVTLLEFTNGRTVIVGNRLYHDGKELDISQFDAVILRTWGKEVKKAERIIAVFENNGVLSNNLSDRITQSNQKIVTQRILERAGIPIPRGIVVDIPFMPRPDFSERLKEKLGSPPYVVKSNHGWQGKGVVKVNNIQEVMDVIKFNEKDGNGYLIQENICKKDINDRSCHYRMFMINGDVAGVMKVTAPDRHEFRPHGMWNGDP